MKSNKPPIIMCCQCTRRENLLEHEGKRYCKFHHPEYVAREKERGYSGMEAEAVASILSMLSGLRP